MNQNQLPRIFNKAESRKQKIIVANADVVVEFYDNTGRLIQKSGKRNYAKGNNTIMMDCSDLPVGVYLCKLIADNQYVTTKKLIKE